jgi:uridine phosphorylase
VPYIAKGSEALIEKLNQGYVKGITLTCPGFYGPQGRQLRLAPRFPDLIQKASQFRYEDRRITNFEMETSGIYAMGQLLGHQCVSISAILANRIHNTFSQQPKKGVEKLIQEVLEKVSQL